VSAHSLPRGAGLNHSAVNNSHMHYSPLYHSAASVVTVAVTQLLLDFSLASLYLSPVFTASRGGRNTAEVVTIEVLT